MARPCMADRRERVRLACERGGLSRSRIADLFGVGESTVCRWQRAWRAEGRRQPKPHAGGPAPRLDEAALDRLKELVAEGNDRTLAEHAAGLRERAGVEARAARPCAGRSGGSACPAEKTLRAAEPDRPALVEARAAWRAELAGIEPRRLVFLDESGIDTRLTRTHARAPRGRRASGTVPWGRWRRLTVLGALAIDGVLAVMRVAAATSTRVFLALVAPVLAPALEGRPDAVVVRDNLAAPKAGAVRAVPEAAGSAYRSLPASAPDLNPIEPRWSKLKAHLRTAGARSREALDPALGPALDAITAQDARGWFRHAGCPAPN